MSNVDERLEFFSSFCVWCEPEVTKCSLTAIGTASSSRGEIWFVCSVAGLPTVCVFFSCWQDILLTNCWDLFEKPCECFAYYVFDNSLSWRTSIDCCLVMIVLGSVKLFLRCLFSLLPPHSPEVKVKGVPLQRTRAVSFHISGWLWLKCEPPTFEVLCKLDKWSGERMEQCQSARLRKEILYFVLYSNIPCAVWINMIGFFCLEELEKWNIFF